MPPRPKPRFQPPSPTLADTLAGPEASSSGARKSSRRKEEEEDEDALFMRNRGRSLREVNKRVAQAVAVAQISSSPSPSSEEDDEDETPKQRGKSRNQNIFKTGKSKALPNWAKKGVIQELLNDSDEEAVGSDSQIGSPSKKRNAGGSGTPDRLGKRVRTRSRSRSLTPPPGLTDVEILRAKIAIERVLSSDDQQILSHVEEVDLEDDGDELHSAETATLDPDLQNIALKVVARASKQKAADDYDGMQQTRPGTSQQESSGGSALVTVCVKWVPHPEDEVMLGRPQQSWSFTVKRHESLKQLFLQISDKAHVLAEDLVLMRGGKQVFTSVSPAGLGVWGQLDLEACDRITFEALRQRFRSVTPAQQEANDPQSDREASAPLSEASVEPDGSDKFKLVLRAPGTKEITLSVRSTTTCGKIVRAFLAVIAKHGGKVPASPRKAAQVRLCIDGEKQHPDTPISECDLEDGDMVEVVGM